MVRNEAEIFTPRLDSACFGLEFLAGLVQVELLVAEAEGVSMHTVSGRIGRDKGLTEWIPLDAAGREDLMLHAQSCLVEAYCSGDVTAGQDDVVDGFYGE